MQNRKLYLTTIANTVNDVKWHIHPGEIVNNKNRKYVFVSAFMITQGRWGKHSYGFSKYADEILDEKIIFTKQYYCL